MNGYDRNLRNQALGIALQAVSNNNAVPDDLLPVARGAYLFLTSRDPIIDTEVKWDNVINLEGAFQGELFPDD